MADEPQISDYVTSQFYSDVISSTTEASGDQTTGLVADYRDPGKLGELEPLPLYGWPGPIFYVIHVIAITCLSTSVVVGTAVIAHFFRTSQCEHFWDNKIGDRLMVYLVLIDVCSAITHGVDHAYVFIARDHAPDMVCRLFGLVLTEFTSAQVVIITFTSVSACVVIIWDKKLGMGTRDWRVLLAAFGIPLVVGVFGVIFRLFGPSGAWCIADLRTLKGRIFYQTFSVIHLIVIVIISCSYITITVYIYRTAQRLDSKTSRYRRSVTSMMTYVLAFLFQWWPMAVITFWSFWSEPAEGFVIMTMFVTNLGPVYNAVAYYYLKHRDKKQKSVRQSVSVSSVKTVSTIDVQP